ncbi:MULTISPECIES: hypothetical protein [unclassified Spirillospora]|uniref:hypothetical protein n=1 Tax=unclassified Spirillospora TaxID=2642701 RepID=UPI00371F1897
MGRVGGACGGEGAQKVLLPEVSVGLVPGGGGTQLALRRLRRKSVARRPVCHIR